jgi:molybdopterin-guanine dinucleotide biosynthesis protein A
MGRDKALLPYGSGALAQHAARAAALAAGSATLVGDPVRYGGLGFPVIPDLHPGEGPLGGILTALAHTNAEWNLVTACDMPRLTPELLRGLLEQAESSGAGVLVPSAEGGAIHPLCAVYARQAFPALNDAFTRGIRSVKEALRATGAVFVSVAQAEMFQNVNTPEEWAAHGQTRP